MGKNSTLLLLDGVRGRDLITLVVTVVLEVAGKIVPFLLIDHPYRFAYKRYELIEDTAPLFGSRRPHLEVRDLALELDTI